MMDLYTGLIIMMHAQHNPEFVETNIVYRTLRGHYLASRRDGQRIIDQTTVKHNRLLKRMLFTAPALR